MKINFFKTQKIRQFSYQPRYYQETEERGGFSIVKHQSRASSFRRQWKEMRQPASIRNHSNRLVWVIVLVLIPILFYFFDFNLSFFLNK